MTKIKIKPEQIIEGQIMAQKDTSGFGGTNMWRLLVKNVDGYWNNVQWMSVGNIQPLFKTKLTRYEECRC